MFIELAKARLRAKDRGKKEAADSAELALRIAEYERLTDSNNDDREWRRAQMIRDGFSEVETTDTPQPQRTIKAPDAPPNLMDGVRITPNGYEINRPPKPTSFSPEVVAAARAKVGQRPGSTVPFGGKQYAFARGNSDVVARRRSTEAAEREAEVRAVNATLPEGERLSETRIKVVALSPTVYNEWAKTALGLDGTADYRKRRDYANSHPAPRRPSSVSGSSSPNTSRALSGVQSQLSDARSDLSRAESATSKRPLIWTSPSDSVEFERKKAQVPPLRAKVDSLSGVRDSLVQETQGHSGTANTQRSLRPLSASELERVKTDADYRAYKESLGYRFDR